PIAPPVAPPAAPPVPPPQPPQSGSQPVRGSGGMAALPLPPRSKPRKEPISALSIGLIVVFAFVVFVIIYAIAKGGAAANNSKRSGDEEAATVKLPSAKAASARPVAPAPGPNAAPARVDCSQAPARIYFSDDFRDASTGWTLDDPWEIGAARASKGG